MTDAGRLPEGRLPGVLRNNQSQGKRDTPDNVEIEALPSSTALPAVQRFAVESLLDDIDKMVAVATEKDKVLVEKKEELKPSLAKKPSRDLRKQRLSLSDRKVLDKIDNMTKEEIENLEGRYLQYKKEDRERQNSLRAMNQTDIKKNEAKMIEMKKKKVTEQEHCEEIQSNKKALQNEKESTTRKEVHDREEDRSLAARRVRRLFTTVICHGLVGQFFKSVVNMNEREKCKIVYFETVAQPRVWDALASAKITAAVRRNLFLIKCVRRYRMRKRRNATAVVAYLLRARKKHFSIRLFYRSTVKIQQWWKRVEKEKKSRVWLVSLQWDRAWDSFYESRVTSPQNNGNVLQIPGFIKYRTLRNVLHQKSKDYVATIRQLEALRTTTKREIEKGLKTRADLDPTTAMLIDSEHVPRLKYLLRQDEITLAIQTAYNSTKALAKLIKSLVKQETACREKIFDEQVLHLAYLADHHSSVLQEAKAEVSHLDGGVLPPKPGSGFAEDTAVTRPKGPSYDAKTGRRLTEPLEDLALPSAAGRSAGPRRGSRRKSNTEK